MGGAVVGLCALDDIGDVVLVGAELDINLRGERGTAAPLCSTRRSALLRWMISGPEAVLPVSPTAFCSCQRLEALYLYNSYFFDVCKVFFGKSIPIFLRPEH